MGQQMDCGMVYGVGDGAGGDGMAVQGQEVEKKEAYKTRIPYSLTQREIDEHFPHHLPYRAWCPYCVRGRGRNTPHRRLGDGQHDGVPRIALDYFFMSSADEAASSNPLLIMLDESTGEKWARAVGQKGPERFGERWQHGLAYKRPFG